MIVLPYKKQVSYQSVFHSLNSKYFKIKLNFIACDLVSQNVAAIFGPNSSRANGKNTTNFMFNFKSIKFSSFRLGIVASICKRLQIPNFVANWQPIDVDDYNGTDSFTRNFFPHPNNYTNALYEIVKSYQWRTFAAIYDSNDNLLKLQNSFTMTMDLNTMGKPKITFYKIPENSNDYRLLFKSISKMGINQVLIDCSLANTLSLLQQSSKVNMMNEYVVCWIFRKFAV